MLDQSNCSICEAKNHEIKVLHDHVHELVKLLDSLSGIVYAESVHVATQTDDQCNTTAVQLQTFHHCSLSDCAHINFDHTEPPLGRDAMARKLSVCSVTSSCDSISQETLSISAPDNECQELVEPYYIYPISSYFSCIDVNQLDSNTAYTHMFKNRSVAYYGLAPYTYGTITHSPKPFASNSYLASILELVGESMPNYVYNSAMITKYQSGKQFMPYHSDSENEICDDSDIITISLGQTRRLCFRAKHNHGAAEKTILLSHGDVMLMSKLSQSHFEHSVPSDYSKSMRISITLRNITPHRSSVASDEIIPDRHIRSSHPDITPDGYSPFVEHIPAGCAMSTQDMIVETLKGLSAPSQPRTAVINQLPMPPVCGYNQSSPLSSVEPTSSAQPQHISSVYISSSMFSELDSIKMCSTKQGAAVFSFSGATAGDMLHRLQKDSNFNNIDPHHVKKIFLLSGTNNIDRILRVPRTHHTDINIAMDYDEKQFGKAKEDIAMLTSFLHSWARSAEINLINILPRASRVRNTIINDLNLFIRDLCNNTLYMNNVNTESSRSLFSNKDGYRKNDYFNPRGTDNVHLNRLGIVRLGKHLKYLAHT